MGIIWRVLLGLGALTFLASGFDILTNLDACEVVTLAHTGGARAGTTSYSCLTDEQASDLRSEGNDLGTTLSGGAAGTLGVAAGLLMLGLATWPLPKVVLAAARTQSASHGPGTSTVDQSTVSLRDVPQARHAIAEDDKDGRDQDLGGSPLLLTPWGQNTVLTTDLRPDEVAAAAKRERMDLAGTVAGLVFETLMRRLPPAAVSHHVGRRWCELGFSEGLRVAQRVFRAPRDQVLGGNVDPTDAGEQELAEDTAGLLLELDLDELERWFPPVLTTWLRAQPQAIATNTPQLSIDAPSVKAMRSAYVRMVMSGFNTGAWNVDMRNQLPNDDVDEDAGHSDLLAPTTATEPSGAVVGQLRELANMHEAGLLTLEEFTSAKARLLGS